MTKGIEFASQLQTNQSRNTLSKALNCGEICLPIVYLE